MKRFGILPPPLSESPPTFQLTPLYLSNFFRTSSLSKFQKRDLPPNLRGEGNYAFATKCNRILNKNIFHTQFCHIVLHSHGHLSLFHFWFELHFLLSNLYLHLHDTCFFNVFNSFIHGIVLNTLRFKSSVLFGTYTLLDKSLRVLQPPKYLS